MFENEAVPGFRKLVLNRCAFQQQPRAGLCSIGFAPVKQLRERRTRTCGDIIELYGTERFHTLIQHLDVSLQSQRIAYGFKEDRFFANRIDKRDRITRHQRNNHSGKAGAASDVQPGRAMCGAFARDELEKLCRIGEMTDPDVRERGRADEVKLCLPLGEQLGIGVEPLLCFT